jgi:hypothetical protein
MYGRIILYKKLNYSMYLFLVPVDLDVRMKAVALGALFLIVRTFVFFH